uniref:Metallothionein-like protein n=1 Tax=Picea sitchensis TaxID=3332 RepID=A9NMB4_PICSI|nr:unknown [Picea sitchensis]ABK22265.1 unknown [Picea sitchensis]ABK25424.1 unknown [Picea sitchensis]ABR16717.1 unknown [Picea sitchensis]ACN40763.1 unknown [Picea sitchensis]
MSTDCANCDCADKTQCPKKQGFQMDGIVETGYEMGHGGAVSLENNDCKCGPNCQCGTCSCHK